MAATTSAVDASKIVTPGSDPWAELMARLGLPPETTKTTTGAQTAPLAALTAQLASQATTAGSADMIKQIFTQGTQAALPVITSTAAATGARAGSSSYQALATNDMNARLAGSAAVALQENAKVATQAASNLAATTGQASQTVVKSTGANNTAQSILLPLAGTVASAVLKGMLDTKKVADVAGAVNPAWDTASVMPSSTDLIFANPGVAAQTTATATNPSAWDVGNLPPTPDLFSSNGAMGAGQSAGVDVLINTILGGRTDSNIMGAAAADAAMAAATGGVSSVAQAAGNILGINEIGQVMAPVEQAGSGIVTGIKSALGCFITTAAVEFMGREDNGYHLTTLRSFRDGWMKEQHPKDIEQYYAEAPAIVETLKKRANAKIIFREFFWSYIDIAADAVSEGQYVNAYTIYRELFNKAKLLASEEI